MKKQNHKRINAFWGLGEKFFLVIKKMVFVIGVAFFLILFLATLVITTNYSDDYTQSALSITLDFFPTILGLLLFLGFLYIKPVRHLCSKFKTGTYAKIALVFGFILSVAWVFIANVRPMWDSQDLVYASDFLKGIRNDITAAKWIGDGAYLARFPHNTPIVALLYLCYLIAGENQVILFELLSCTACAFTMFFIVKLTSELFKKKVATAISALLVITFAPIILYCTFIYGNILCLPFALGAFLMQIRAAKNRSNTKMFIKYFIISYLLIAVSIFFKSTMLFPAIAITLVWLYLGIKEKKKLFLVIPLLALYLAKNSILPLNMLIESRGNEQVNLHNGTPTISWIVMGTGASKEYFSQTTNPETDTEDIDHYPGFFDGYVWIQGDDGTYSSKNISKIGLHYLKVRLLHFIERPLFALKFFGKKLAIEWTEPTYEGFIASNWCREDMDYIACEREYTPLARSFYYGKANTVLTYIMNLQQTLFAFGCLVALWKNKKKADFSDIAIIMCILGMAFVYLLWENKSQYIFPIYLFMIPFAAFGLSSLYGTKKAMRPTIKTSS